MPEERPAGDAEVFGLSRRGLFKGGAGWAALAALAAANGRLPGAGATRATLRGSATEAWRSASARSVGARDSIAQAADAPSTAPIRIFLAPDDHTAYMRTADEAEYRRAFVDMLDYQLNLIDATEDLPAEHQAKWTCDGSIWLWEYERSRDARAFERLVARIRDGHISVPLNPSINCYGGAPAEAILRGMYYAGRLERRHGLKLPLVIATKSQTLPYGLASLWAGSGALYAWKGVCGCDTRVPELHDRDHDIYWWVGPDGRRLLMKWHSLLVDSQGSGGYAEARHPEVAVRAVTEEAVANGFRARYPYGVIGLFGQGADDLETYGDDTIRAAIDLSDETRTVAISNTVDFFEAFEAAHGDTLPRVSMSFGNEWDTRSASMQEVSARVRRAVERLRAAEALTALETTLDLTFDHAYADERDEAFMALGLYHEHGWGASGPIGHDQRSDWQRLLAERVETYVDGLFERGRMALGSRIGVARAGVSGVSGPAPDAPPRFFAFNPLGWEREDLADIDWGSLSLVEDGGGGAFHVVDIASGLTVPSQRDRRDGVDMLRVWAEGVPGVGYRVFEVRPGSGPEWPNAAAISSGALVNDHYQIEVSPHGTIDRLLDRARGNRDLVREIDGRRLNALGAWPEGEGRITIESTGPVSVTLRADIHDPIRRITRITLDRGGRRIAIDNELLGPLDATLAWDFPFDLTTFEAWHEEVGAIALARLSEAGGHYSERNARYDWLSMGHFVALADSARSITLSNRDCSFFRLGHSTVEDLDTATPRISALACGQVDGSALGIRAQGGDERFRYAFALCVDDVFSATTSMRFSLEHQNPLVTGRVKGDTSDGSLWPSDRFALLTITPPEALLWALKVADDGPEHGLVARLWNVSKSRIGADIAFAPPLTVAAADRMTHIETPIGPADVRDGVLHTRLAGGAMETVRLLPGRLAVGGGKAVALPWVGR